MDAINLVRRSATLQTDGHAILRWSHNPVDLAKEMHNLSARRLAPFATIDCTGTPPHELDHLVFSENGVMSNTVGGTLYLFRPDLLSQAAQRRLFCHMRGHGYYCPGTDDLVTVDVRIIVGTTCCTTLDNQIFTGFEYLFRHNVEIPSTP
jgi:transcriptional regulator with AAA-type ATPase domain